MLFQLLTREYGATGRRVCLRSIMLWVRIPLFPQYLLIFKKQIIIKKEDQEFVELVENFSNGLDQFHRANPITPESKISNL